MNLKNCDSKCFIKHILSSDWIEAKCISDNDDFIEFLIEDTNDVSFEKDDKIIYSIKSRNKSYTFNTVVSDIDFPTYNKITVITKKPFERRKYSRYNVFLHSNLTLDFESDDVITVDVSRNGFKILTNTDLNIKNKINLNIFISDNTSINVDCVVVYKNLNQLFSDDYKYICGLKITNISIQDDRLLEDFINSLK